MVNGYTEIYKLAMSVATKLARLRRDRGLTQTQLANSAGLHVNQIRRYETGVAQPSLDALKKIAIALRSSVDSLVFEDGEREPHGDLKRQFEVISQMREEDQKAIMSILDGMILKHQTRKLLSMAS